MGTLRGMRAALVDIERARKGTFEKKQLRSWRDEVNKGVWGTAAGAPWLDSGESRADPKHSSTLGRME